jgi:hypothetical protein
MRGERARAVPRSQASAGCVWVCALDWIIRADAVAKLMRDGGRWGGCYTAATWSVLVTLVVGLHGDRLRGCWH